MHYVIWLHDKTPRPYMSLGVTFREYIYCSKYSVTLTVIYVFRSVKLYEQVAVYNNFNMIPCSLFYLRVFQFLATFKAINKECLYFISAKQDEKFTTFVTNRF